MPPGKEHQPPYDIAPELISGLTAAFIHRTDTYSIQLHYGAYRRIAEPLTPHLVTAHLQGKLTLGAYALDGQSIAHWLVLDADDEAGWEGLITLTRDFAEQGMTGYLERSRRGGHLWMFTPPLPGADIRRFGKHFLSQHGLEDMELFPKQDRLQTGVGSLVRLPFGIHRKTGKRYHFITPEGEPLARTIREQIAILSQPERIPQAYIEGILSTLPEPKIVFPTRSFKKRKGQGETPSERIKNSVSILDFVSQFVEGHPRSTCGVARIALEFAAMRNTFVTVEIITQAANKRFVD
jgi:hypothetical protein